MFPYNNPGVYKFSWSYSTFMQKSKTTESKTHWEEERVAIYQGVPKTWILLNLSCHISLSVIALGKSPR